MEFSVYNLDLITRIVVQLKFRESQARGVKFNIVCEVDRESNHFERRKLKHLLMKIAVKFSGII
jgi:hypothetical protein